MAAAICPNCRVYLVEAKTPSNSGYRVSYPAASQYVTAVGGTSLT